MIIGISGKSRCGKSTIAESYEDLGYSITSFASPIKDMLLALGLSDDQLYGEAKDLPCVILYGATPREAMIELSTSWTTKFSSSFWIDRWQAALPGHFYGNKGGIIVDDVRYPQEALAILDLGGKLIHVDRFGLAKLGGEGHVSESHTDTLRAMADVRIVNEGTVEELLAAVRSISFPTRTVMGTHRRTPATF